MKNLNILLLLFSAISLSSCEEVIELDLKESKPRLVIDASLIWYLDTSGNNQEIILSKTTGFYEEEINPVTDAEVVVETINGERFIFTHQEQGIYTNTNFNPVFEKDYTLEIIYQDEIYTSSSSFVPASGIDYIAQNSEGGFTREDLEVEVYFTDPVDENNFYLFNFRNISESKISLEIYEDEFTNGNQVSVSYSNEELMENDEIHITMEGISPAFYQYLFILRSQGGNNGGGPFQSQPATVKGNIVNETNPENYPFGYFRLSQADSTTYIVQ
ncbi:uncharacterized protein DUF4249 [Salegentibacter sp. 24]|jgi:hypothetical protein|uniref:DUF4249 domain-containing protein n=1 Tax=Salegentibacter sp. 24 TaxID=2183986 RepID=UPI0010608166|nr:DUF4249 domain-containing protein [Salegentibacter sp. 24]TDN88681.1 uncharacterized protein DUF4249 [Salegentibacter sp. 24]